MEAKDKKFNCLGCGQLVTPLQNHPVECCESFKAGQEDTVQVSVAEIYDKGYKAGYEAHETEWSDAVLARGKREGIRIVVEWGDEDCDDHENFEGRIPTIKTHFECPQCWQAKLREWGI